MNIRVTQNSITRQYNRNLNSTLSQMNKISNKILTERKFLRASENSIGAARALSIRKSLADISTYKDNLSTASGILSSAESSLKIVSSEVTTVTDKIISAINADKGQSERDIIAEEIENVAKDMMKELNSQYADRRLFGGTNNSSQAFTYDETTGLVSFNGTAINTDEAIEGTNGNFYFGGENISALMITDADSVTAIVADNAPYYINESDVDTVTTPGSVLLSDGTDITTLVNDGTIIVSDELITSTDGRTYLNPNEITEAQANGDNFNRFRGTKAILIDVGIGIQYDANGMIDPSTALDISLNGAQLTGSGVDDDGLANNVIQLAFDAAQALRDGDRDGASAILDKINEANSTLLIGITNLGVREQAITFNQTSLEDDEYNLSAAQIEVEGMSIEDIAEADTEFTVIQAAYNAILQMGSSVVPTSIFDFIK